MCSHPRTGDVTDEKIKSLVELWLNVFPCKKKDVPELMIAQLGWTRLTSFRALYQTAENSLRLTNPFKNTLFILDFFVYPRKQ